ncbi:uncharacterized protein PFL1_05297 [Pseudozyma flocculosa PF-1]|uniref:Uncharacterized protein n=2 Tax=Pseudozyma flocculosa TaxID=84751 RepID=A0A5C3FF53_9BASI|nr:uncharacterized protein PFL1_05297 [Pseudozyma flocculosa PF-1]EPQ27013.1 hypothetical protein PFL1_05297 [Pseudozyma flocculosa PF-1]SPO42009.1 uncharacterized protein PSFLO_07492 [Pseudozyma flocculosa]
MWSVTKVEADLPFTVTRGDGSIVKLDGFSGFLNETGASLLCDVGIKIRLLPVGHGYCAPHVIDSCLVNVHVRELTSLSSARTVFRLDNVSTGAAADPRLMALLRRQGRLSGSEASVAQASSNKEPDQASVCSSVR